MHGILRQRWRWRAPRRIAVLCLVSLLVASREASAEWTLGLFIGAARTQDTSLTIAPDAPTSGHGETDLRLSSVHYRSESFDSPLYYGYRVGFFPAAGWFGIEGEFIHLKVIVDTDRTVDARGLLRGQRVDGPIPLRSVVERFSITHGVNLLLINGVVRLRDRGSRPHAGRATTGAEADLPRWLLTARFGAGPTIPHPESIIDGRSFDHYEWGALALQGAGGVELRVHGPLFAVAEYKLTRTVQDVTIVGGHARTPLVSHHFVAGVALHLGERSVRRAR